MASIVPFASEQSPTLVLLLHLQLSFGSACVRSSLKFRRPKACFIGKQQVARRLWKFFHWKLAGDNRLRSTNIACTQVALCACQSLKAGKP